MTHISRPYPLCQYGMMKPRTGLIPDDWSSSHDIPFVLFELIKRRGYSEIIRNFVFRIKNN